jgi:hypothetical protein
VSFKSGDLTTLTTAQAYLVNPPNAVVLTGFITRMSAAVRGELARKMLIPTTFNQQFNGTGTRALVLPEWPVLAINSFYVGGVQVNLAPQAGPNTISFPPNGYRYQPWDGNIPGDPAVVELVGGAWLYTGYQNVVVNYTAGYQVTGEVPTSAPWTPTQPQGIWATDQGVMFTGSKVPLVPITVGPPGSGYYVPPAPDATTPTYTYLFYPADVVTGLSISYGFVPYMLEEAVLEWIASRAAWRTRPGVRSQSLASQESFSYDTAGIPDGVLRLLRGFKSVLPPAIGSDA